MAPTIAPVRCHQESWVTLDMFENNLGLVHNITKIMIVVPIKMDVKQETNGLFTANSNGELTPAWMDIARPASIRNEII